MVTRGVIRFDEEKRTVTVTGYLNWYIIFTLGALLLAVLDDPGNGAYVLQVLGFALLFGLAAWGFWYSELQLYPRVVAYLDAGLGGKGRGWEIGDRG